MSEVFDAPFLYVLYQNKNRQVTDGIHKEFRN